MRRKGKRKWRSGRRNLLVIGVLLLGIMGVIAFVALHEEEVVRIYPPDTDLEARRASEENAYWLVMEAYKLLPEKPEALLVPAEEGGDPSIWYWPEKGSLGKQLDIYRPDDDPEFLAYLRACGPAAEKVREALEKPYFLYGMGEGFQFRSYGPEVSAVGLTLLARGAAAGRIEGKPENGYPDLIAVMRLARWQAYNPRRFQPNLHDGAIEEYRRVAVACESPELLKEIQEALEALGPPFLPYSTVLESHWRGLDRALGSELKELFGDSIPSLIEARLWQRRLAKRAKFVIQHREELLKLADGGPGDFDTWAGKVRGEARAWNGLRAELSEESARAEELADESRALWQARHSGMLYYAAVLGVALERFKRESGAYPETLDELVPKYVGKVPENPARGDAYSYERVEEGYRLLEV